MKTLYPILFFILFIGCSDINGVIIKREKCEKNFQWVGSINSKQQFLLNNSTSSKASFTLRLKKTYHQNDKVEFKEETLVYELNPGEEVQLNCEKVFDNRNPKTWISFDYKIVGTLSK